LTTTAATVFPLFILVILHPSSSPLLPRFALCVSNGEEEEETDEESPLFHKKKNIIAN